MLPASEWRTMRPTDLDAVAAISDAVHGEFTEDRAIYAERLALFPQGCRVFANPAGIGGYLIVHPWHRGAPPALGQLLGAIPTDADTLYLHDIALLPAARGSGAGGKAMAFAIDLANAGGFDGITLMAVNGADSYWASLGFTRSDGPVSPSYGADAQLMHRAIAA